MLRRTLLSVFAIAAVCWPQAALVEEVEKIEEAWTRAVIRGDLKTLDAMLADDLVYAHSNGLIETKSEYLAKLKTGNQKYASIDQSNTKTRVYGNTGVVTTTARMTGATKGVPFDNTLHMTHVWVKQGNAWKLVLHQTTRMP